MTNPVLAPSRVFVTHHGRNVVAPFRYELASDVTDREATATVFDAEGVTVDVFHVRTMAGENASVQARGEAEALVETLTEAASALGPALEGTDARDGGTPRGWHRHLGKILVGGILVCVVSLISMLDREQDAARARVTHLQLQMDVRHGAVGALTYYGATGSFRGLTAPKAGWRAAFEPADVRLQYVVRSATEVLVGTSSTRTHERCVMRIAMSGVAVFPSDIPAGVVVCSTGTD